MSTDTPKTQPGEAQQALPPLSAQDFRTYNRLAVRMDAFVSAPPGASGPMRPPKHRSHALRQHNHFRATWKLLWDACVAGRRPQKMSLRDFIRQGLEFASQLEMHHRIEEQHVFPELAAKMPEFNHETGPMVLQHVQIHAGLDKFQAYLRKCQSGEVDFELGVLREKMESWGGVLWTHLDEEVKTLGAENMRKHWTKEELKNLPM